MGSKKISANKVILHFMCVSYLLKNLHINMNKNVLCISVKIKILNVFDE